MKKILLLVAGVLSLLLGLIGIILPVLPTTPFLLLSAACFFNSSTRLYLWLTNHKILGEYINSYIKYKAISIRSKIISITLLLIMLSISIIFFVEITWVKILLIFIGLSVSTYLYTRTTLTKEMLKNL